MALDIGRDLLVTLEMVTRGVDQLKQANEQVSKWSQQKPTSIQHEIGITTSGLDAAREGLKAMGKLTPELERSFTAARNAVELYSKSVTSASARRDSLKREIRELREFEQASKRAFSVTGKKISRSDSSVINRGMERFQAQGVFLGGDTPNQGDFANAIKGARAKLRAEMLSGSLGAEQGGAIVGLAGNQLGAGIKAAVTPAAQVAQAIKETAAAAVPAIAKPEVIKTVKNVASATKEVVQALSTAKVKAEGFEAVLRRIDAIVARDALSKATDKLAGMAPKGVRGALPAGFPGSDVDKLRLHLPRMDEFERDRPFQAASAARRRAVAARIALEQGNQPAPYPSRSGIPYTPPLFKEGLGGSPGQAQAAAQQRIAAARSAADATARSTESLRQGVPAAQGTAAAQQRMAAAAVRASGATSMGARASYNQAVAAAKTARSATIAAAAAQRQAVANAKSTAVQKKGFFASFKEGAQHSQDTTLMGSIGFATARLGRYALAAAIVFNIQRAFREAVKAGVEFENFLADIQGITPSKLSGVSDHIGDAAISNARMYGVVLNEAVQAAKTFAQTGASASKVAQDINASLLATRGIGIPLEQAKELIIAIQNISEGEVEALDILDRISRVEARRAITAGDLATAIQRVGPVVHQLKGDMVGLVDEFDAAMGAVTTVVEQTRVTGGNAATSLRFIMSRLGNVEIVGKLQELSGVGFARKGGKELRPFLEILQDVSIAYERLKKGEEGGGSESGRASQILTTLGGARQIQATAALLGSFSKVQDTATLSAYAFGDAQERAAIKMNTISAASGQLGAAFATAGAKVVTNPLINWLSKGTLRVLQVFPDAITGIFKALDTGGSSKFAPKFLDFATVKPEQVEKLKSFAIAAGRAQLSTQDLVDVVAAASATGGWRVLTKYGKSLSELIQMSKDGTDGGAFRNVRTELGESMVTSLERVPGLLDQYTTKAEKTAAALGLLADAAFITNAVLDTNNQKLRESVAGIQDVFIDSFAKQIANPAMKFEPKLFTGATPDPAKQFREFQSYANVNKFRMIKALSDEDEALGGILSSLLNATDATDAFKIATLDAFNSAVPAARSFAAIMDQTLSSITSPEKRQAAVDRITQGLYSTVLKDGAPGSASLANLMPAGGQSISLMTSLMNDAGEQLLAMANVAPDKVAEVLKRYNAALGESALNTQDWLKVTEKAYARVNSRITDMLTQFVISTESATQLDEIYGRLGINFDVVNQKFQAATTLLVGLTKVQNELRGEIVKNEKQMAATEAVFAATTVKDALAAVKMAGEEGGMDPPMSTTAEKQTDKQKEIIGQLRAELKALVKDNSLRKVWGDSAEGQQMLDLFNKIMTDYGMTADQVLLSYSALMKGTEIIVGLNHEILVGRLRDVAALTEVASLQKMITAEEMKRIGLRDKSGINDLQRRSKLASELLDISERYADSVRSQISADNAVAQQEIANARVRAKMEIEAVRVQEAYGRSEAMAGGSTGSVLTAELEKVSSTARIAIAQIGEELTTAEISILSKLSDTNKDLILDNILEKYKSLSSQVQSNVDSATSGLKSVLTDYNKLRKGSIATILSPIGETFIKQTAENLSKNLFQATGTGFFSKIAQAYGAGPEQRMRSQLEAAMSIGGTDIADKFRAAGNDVAAQMSAIYGGTAGAPGVSAYPTLGGGILPKDVLSTQVSAMAAKLQREQDIKDGKATPGAADADIKGQLALLVGSQIGTFAGGGGSNAALGAQLAGTLGSFLPGGPVTGALAAVVGGAIGGLFDKDDAESKAQTQSLQRIEEYTSRSATVLELERRFLDITRGAFNLPASFTIPQYSPNSGGQAQIKQTNSIRVDVNVNSPANGNEVVATIRRELGTVLSEELRKIGV